VKVTAITALVFGLMCAGCGEKNRTSMATPARPAAQGSASRVVDNNATMRGPMGQDRIAREVRHELVMLPYYGVFDDLSYQVNGSTVTLTGHVTRPTLKSDAENVVKHVEGVERVVNAIEVLPLSPMDDRIRIAAYRAIYGQTGLDRYALQAVPPIHVIVANGNVTLTGVVSSQADKDMAGVRANGVPGVFGVTNNLRVESEGRQP
jgi:hyperosmotically inducible periplasmic protein